ncbi:SigE family RNA polymerase sigma factor [Kineosporia sp. J2-2]|uniref:SigE family RNA polymerase sigma factor n=1 Tax=Kineosporia corallincola TaxID=2835133 RepID=A0ABS5TPV8_9ACTN|nr:SigE family RNA polymerase sigma factor [Kineosporia corallincola]MBT0773145.1 SigE family RNA polymerase sigma factor [Kineosporia corallincola]
MKQDLKDRFQLMALAELPRLRRFALAVCGDPHQADDHVQNTLERMYVAWPRVHDISRPGAYLRAILVRQMLNEKRRPWRREHSADRLPDPGYETTPGADLHLDLSRALAGLTTKQRAVVVMRYVEDRPVAEVAQIMRITPGTVKRQCADAVVRLRRVLGDDFIDDGADEVRAVSSTPVLDLDETGRGLQ